MSMPKSVSGNFNLYDVPRPERPLEADVDKIKSLVDANRRKTTREITEQLNLSNATVHKRMKCLGLIFKPDMFLQNEICFVALTTAIRLLDV